MNQFELVLKKLLFHVHSLGIHFKDLFQIQQNYVVRLSFWLTVRFDSNRVSVPYMTGISSLSLGSVKMFTSVIGYELS